MKGICRLDGFTAEHECTHRPGERRIPPSKVRAAAFHRGPCAHRYESKSISRGPHRRGKCAEPDVVGCKTKRGGNQGRFAGRSDLFRKLQQVKARASAAALERVDAATNRTDPFFEDNRMFPAPI